MFRPSLWAGALLCAMAFTGSAAAQSKNDAAVEAILAEALVERGAYAACADLAPGKAEAGQRVATSWKLDLADTAKLLRASGFDENYVVTLVNRSSLEKATPRFADPTQLAAFCGSLGNWQERMNLLMNITPQESIARLLKRREQ